MEFFITIIWFSLPVFFLFLAGVQVLDMISSKKDAKYLKIYISQFIFTSIAAIATYFIDQFIFPYEWFEGVLDLNFFKITLFPIVLLLCSLVYGGSAPVKITKDLDRYSYLNK